jgi:hypothetical protein
MRQLRDQGMQQAHSSALALFRMKLQAAHAAVTVCGNRACAVTQSSESTNINEWLK